MIAAQKNIFQSLKLFAIAFFVISLSQVPEFAYSASRANGNTLNGYALYVSPSGNDNNAGTLDQPLQTIQKAQEVVRTLNQNMDGNITVYLRGGTYVLDQPITLGAADSGTNGYTVTYQNYSGENPILSSEKKVTNWSQDGTNTYWKSFLGAGLSMRQLYVNGERETRARSDTPLPVYQKTTQGYLLNDPDISFWDNISDIEFVSAYRWKLYRCGVQNVVGSDIVMQQPCWNNAQYEYTSPMGSPDYLENAMELLDKQGEWYYNKSTGWVYYLPYPGQDMATADVSTPTLETLVQATGTTDSPVHDVQFNGLTFAYTTWLAPNTGDGYVPVQSNIHYVGQTTSLAKIPAAVSFHSVHNVTVQNSVFTHLGDVGVTFEVGSKNNEILNNHFTDISGTAIQIGDFDQPHATGALLTKNNVVSDNYIHDVAKEYQDGVGFWLGYVQSSQVLHNELFDLPYTGISIGWGWGNDDPSIAQDNHIGNNYIHDHVQSLVDGGGIYTLSSQPGNSISGNVITGEKNSNGGIYLDQGSRYITVDGNAVFDNVRNLFANGGENTFTGNYWQNRFPDDLFIAPSQFGDNTIENNHEILLSNEVPESIFSNAGLELSALDVVPYLEYPTNVKNVCSSDGNSVQLFWNHAIDNPQYSLFVDDQTNDNPNDPQDWFQAGQTDLSTQVSGATYTHTTQCNHSYHWWVSDQADTTHVASSNFTCSCPPGDTESPSTPTGLGVDETTQTTVSFHWNPATDNVGVTGYQVYRDGTIIDTIHSTSFTDAGLTPGTSYIYSIRSLDAAGNISGYSGQLSVATLAVLAPVSVSAPATPLPPVLVEKRPSITSLKLFNGGFQLPKGKSSVLVKPYGNNYRGIGWAKKIDLGNQGIFYLFLPDHSVPDGKMIMIDQKGKKIASMTLPKKYFAGGGNVDLYYSVATEKLFVAMANPDDHALRVFSFYQGRLVKIQTLTNSVPKESLAAVRFTQLLSKQVVLSLVVRKPHLAPSIQAFDYSGNRLVQQTITAKNISLIAKTMNVLPAKP